MNNYVKKNRQPRRNGQILRKVQSPKTEPGRMENMNKIGRAHV